MSHLLELSGLHAGYGRMEVLRGIGLVVDEGEIVCLIGANGAGKTTTLACISGLIRPTQGKIRFSGHDLGRRPGHEIVSLGLSQVPEGRRIFAELTVRENLEMGAYARRDREGIRKDLERVNGLFPILVEREKQLGGTLSGGEQQMLAIGRAMMARPKMLLLDEPSLGLAPIIVRQIFEVVRELNREGVTILLVEQNAGEALRLSSRGYVLETGSIPLSGYAKDLIHHPDVKKAYLGED